MNNIPSNVQAKIGINLHNNKNHPIGIIKNKIYSYFGDSWSKFDDISPVVSIKNNFDDLLIPYNHPARSKSDTYYINENSLLRTHTSAHQSTLISQGIKKFLVTGDVYRKDEIDCRHYPIFHQMEGVCIGESKDQSSCLKNTLNGLVEYLFPGIKYRILDDSFPFTNPSFQYEIEWKGNWIEILGCGVIHPKILSNAGIDESGFAFGLGLERLAMILFEIPDIRLFWSNDKRFTSQFQDGKVVKFQSYSKYPSVYKDLSFYVNDKFDYNNMCEIIRYYGNDLVESVAKKDEFSKNGKLSLCYRITFSSMDRNLTNEEINIMNNKIREELNKIGYELR